MSYTPDNSITKTNMILDLLSQKQQVIGANLANVNTPGYVRRDIDFGQMLNTANSPLETKLSTKLGASPSVKEVGGEVSTPQELMEIQKNMLFYTVAARRLTSVIQEIRTVTQVGK
jgi:flagellar basal-body rod protein FlgB